MDGITGRESKGPTPFVRDFDSLGTAEAIQGFLKSEGVGSHVEVVQVTAGVPTRVQLTVPGELAHRARALLADAEVTDRELTFLATGELDPEPE